MDNKKPVLIIDDMPLIREQIQAALENESSDYEFVHAASFDEAHDAMAKAAQASKPFYFVSTDFNLTNNGSEGARISQMAKMLWPDMPVIVVSTVVETDLKNLKAHCGADAYLTKPFNSAKFVAAMKQAFENARLAHAA